MKAILGTMNIGKQVFGADAEEMLRCFHDAGGVELDSAYVYNDGACEEILGECFRSIGAEDFIIGTKANPRITGKLDGAAVHAQLAGSLERMGINRADIFYLHFPDPTVPLEDPLAAIAEEINNGKIVEFGLSNYSKEDLLAVIELCDQHGWKRPSVYEGVYNPLSRRVEDELMDCLNEMGMRFYAYNPLAGGLLTGKYHDVNSDISGGRFDLRVTYKKRYWKESFFQALQIIRDACGNAGIGMAEATYRWLVHHSALDSARGDGVLIGASRVEQLSQNMGYFNYGKLPASVVVAFDEVWSVTKDDAPDYYRQNELPVKGR